MDKPKPQAGPLSSEEVRDLLGPVHYYPTDDEVNEPSYPIGEPKPCSWCGGAPRIGTPRIGASSVVCETPSCPVSRWGPTPWHVWQYRPVEDALRSERDVAIARAEKAEANYAFMVNRAASGADGGPGLAGHRELGARALAAEERCERMLAIARTAAQRTRDAAAQARKHRLAWAESAQAESSAVESLVRRIERAALPPAPDPAREGPPAQVEEAPLPGDDSTPEAR
jgi:hypothetical protein